MKAKNWSVSKERGRWRGAEIRVDGENGGIADEESKELWIKDGERQRQEHG